MSSSWVRATGSQALMGEETINRGLPRTSKITRRRWPSSRCLWSLRLPAQTHLKRDEGRQPAGTVPLLAECSGQPTQAGRGHRGAGRTRRVRKKTLTGMLTVFKINSSLETSKMPQRFLQDTKDCSLMPQTLVLM